MSRFYHIEPRTPSHSEPERAENKAEERSTQSYLKASALLIMG